MFNSNPGHRSLLMPSTAQTYPPVSVGELPSNVYQISTETITEDVVSHLESHPQIPGVTLLHKGKIHSLVPRNKMFERLSHRYGVELFLRKPILELQDNLQTATCIISSNIRVHNATNIALGREIQNIYDPLVMEYNDGVFRMLDMHVLLRAQSLILENSHNVISNLNRIEQSIKAEIPLDASLDMIIDAIKRVAPYHRAAILIKPDRWEEIYSQHPILYRLSESLSHHQIIKTIFVTKQYSHIEDTQIVSLWKGMDSLGKTRTWLGSPILGVRGFDGILSLGRITPTPFSKNEIDMVKIFSDLLSIVINRNNDEMLFTEMIKRKFM